MQKSAFFFCYMAFFRVALQFHKFFLRRGVFGIDKACTHLYNERKNITI